MPQNIAEFRIIGRIAKIDARDNVTSVNIASNYNRQKDGEWEQDTHWNRISAFAKVAERAQSAQVGDLVHVTGRVRQSSYMSGEQTVYSVDLLADSFSVLAQKAAEPESEA